MTARRTRSRILLPTRDGRPSVPLLRRRSRTSTPFSKTCNHVTTSLSPSGGSSPLCAESAHISARLLAKNLQTAPVAESPLPRVAGKAAPRSRCLCRKQSRTSATVTGCRASPPGRWVTPGGAARLRRVMWLLRHRWSSPTGVCAAVRNSPFARLSPRCGGDCFGADGLAGAGEPDTPGDCRFIGRPSQNCGRSAAALPLLPRCDGASTPRRAHHRPAAAPHRWIAWSGERESASARAGI